MAYLRKHLLALLACSVTTLVCGEELPLPKEIKGRYSAVGTSSGQVFTLSDITQRPDSTFAAKLTWWTTQASCTVRAAPITGRVTPTGLAFDSKTNCDVAFSIELNRQEKGWVGKGSTAMFALEIKVD
jgi:hypothetical protein